MTKSIFNNIFLSIRFYKGKSKLIFFAMVFLVAAHWLAAWCRLQGQKHIVHSHALCLLRFVVVQSGICPQRQRPLFLFVYE